MVFHSDAQTLDRNVQPNEMSNQSGCTGGMNLDKDGEERRKTWIHFHAAKHDKFIRDSYRTKWMPSSSHALA